MLDADGELVVAVTDMAATDELTPEHVDAARDLVATAGIVVLDGNLSAETMQFALDLAGGQRLVFQPKRAGAAKAPTTPDWKRVTAVEIIFIGDYHD